LELFIAFVMGLYMISLPMLAYYILKGKRDDLYKFEVKMRIYGFYRGIHLFRDPQNIFYYPIFITRRLVFAVIPTFLYMFPFA
jgi:hypothetical protein